MVSDEQLPVSSGLWRNRSGTPQYVLGLTLAAARVLLPGCRSPCLPLRVAYVCTTDPCPLLVLSQKASRARKVHSLSLQVRIDEIPGRFPVIEVDLRPVTCDRGGDMDQWLRWGLIYIAVIVVVFAIFAPSPEPWTRLKELLQCVAKLVKR